MQITRRLTLFGAAATPAVAMPIAQTTPGPDAELLALRRTFLASTQSSRRGTLRRWMKTLASPRMTVGGRASRP